ncbi:hypothetical protein [Paenibacillus sp. RC67]|uniref:hypothetical protein n=1 Tax=Paenibacillus sp. RC67 TaxID=3039392 RepID=UPI0024AD47C2|nr:hypothetical protein [Paenibacillus sp. RC67]
MKLTKWWIPVLIILSFLVGYYVRGLTSNQGFGHQWIRAAEPPLPGIRVNEKQVPVLQGTYSWCSGALFNASCKVVDMIPPAEIIKEKGVQPVVVPPNTMITTIAPPGIKSFTLTRNDNKDNSDPYQTPAEKGIYMYSIHCEWFADQGNAQFYFTIEVQ